MFKVRMTNLFVPYLDHLLSYICDSSDITVKLNILFVEMQGLKKNSKIKILDKPFWGFL
jgi:hypothetical protein